MTENVSIDLLIEQAIKEMQKENALTEAELEYWRGVLRERFENGGKSRD